MCNTSMLHPQVESDGYFNIRKIRPQSEKGISSSKRLKRHVDIALLRNKKKDQFSTSMLL